MKPRRDQYGPAFPLFGIQPQFIVAGAFRLWYSEERAEKRPTTLKAMERRISFMKRMV